MLFTILNIVGLEGKCKYSAVLRDLLFLMARNSEFYIQYKMESQLMLKYYGDSIHSSANN